MSFAPKERPRTIRVGSQFHYDFSGTELQPLPARAIVEILESESWKKRNGLSTNDVPTLNYGILLFNRARRAFPLIQNIIEKGIFSGDYTAFLSMDICNQVVEHGNLQEFVQDGDQLPYIEKMRTVLLAIKNYKQNQDAEKVLTPENLDMTKKFFAALVTTYIREYDPKASNSSEYSLFVEELTEAFKEIKQLSQKS